MSKSQRCRGCGKPYDCERYRRGYCSPACKQRAYRQRSVERENLATRFYNGEPLTGDVTLRSAGRNVTDRSVDAPAPGRQGSEASSSSTKTPSNGRQDLEGAVKVCGVKVSWTKGKAVPNE